MTKKEMWLKIFQENDVALAMAIFLVEKNLREEDVFIKNKQFVMEKITEMYTVNVDSEQLALVFPDNDIV